MCSTTGPTCSLGIPAGAELHKGHNVNVVIIVGNAGNAGVGSAGKDFRDGAAVPFE